MAVRLILPALVRSQIRHGSANSSIIPLISRSRLNHLHHRNTYQLHPLSAQSRRHNSSKTTPENGKTNEDKSSATATPAPTEVAKPSLWDKVKHEAKHYWDGTKLLGLEIKISSRLLIKLLTGYELTRREFNQLKRTTSDLVRVVPFAMFVIIPFAELLLPIALKLFPNMLPSTYESTADKEKKLKLLRKTRKTVSDILIESVDKTGVRLPASFTPVQKAQFQEFFTKIKSATDRPTRDELLNVARTFKEDMVLDNLSKPQLVAMAKYINLKPFGTDQMLRYRIRYQMLQIKADDKAIDFEGVEALTVPELQFACASRGIKNHGVAPTRLRDDLQIWLNLRLREKIPSTLLLLSNAYTYGELSSVSNLYDALETVLSSIPNELIHEAQIDIAPRKEVSNTERLNVIKEQEELIKSEIQQEKDSGSIIQVKDTLKLDEVPPQPSPEAKEEVKKEKNA
ncbi:Ylh47 protein [Saccharomycopsis crataegensis]|uniref:Ylh47 protein n=1 Tax=Saccharomycopsis crataegensis TaxID=43959 RepID=A0AAV5QV84_9ASCO|nr:Ylh47 protein [Saccharomycopsis crataegensis]